MTPRINFGRYNGQPFTDIPTGYLEWLITIPSRRKAKEFAHEELERRSKDFRVIIEDL